jgi:hypothetical protein
MNYPNLQKFAQEADEMQNLSPASIELHPLGALALISLVQAAIRNPEIENHGWGKIGITVARQLQENFFNKDTEVYKVLEYGSDPIPESAESVPSDQM